MQFFTENILLIFILPVIAAGLAFAARIFKYSVSENTVKFSAITASIISLIYAVALFYSYNIDGATTFEISANWLNLGELSISFGVLIDKFSTLFFLAFAIITLVANCVMIKKFKDDEKFCQNLGYLNLFAVISEVLIFSQNIPQAYIFSVLTGVFAFLISTNADEAPENTTMAMTMNRIGDVAFLAGLVILFIFTANFHLEEGSTLLSFSELHMFAPDFYVYLSDAGFYTASLFLITGIVAKAGLFPMHNIFAEQTKTVRPIYATVCTLTTGTGAFLLLRLFPMLELSESVTQTLYVLGVATVIILCIFAFCQNKKSVIFAYTQQSLVGLIFIFTALKNPSAVYYWTALATLTAVLFSIIQPKDEESALCRKLPAPILNFLRSGGNISQLYRWIGGNIVDFFANFTKVIDKYVIQWFINAISAMTKFTSWCVSLTQNGNIQSYIAFGIFGTATILIVYILLVIGIGEM